MTSKPLALLANIFLLISLAQQANGQEISTLDEDGLRSQVSLFEQEKPVDQEKLAAARIELAKLLKAKNSLASARELTVLALESQENFFGESSIKTIPALVLMIDLRGENKFDGRNYLKLEKALTLLSAQDRKQAVKYRIGLAQVYLSNGEKLEAKRLWFQCVDLLRDHLPADCKDLASQCKDIFAILSRREQWNEAQVLALGMAEYGFDQNVLVSAANGFVVLSQHRKTFGDYKEAYHLASRGLKIADKYGGKQNCSYVGALKQLVEILRLLGNTKKADKLEREASKLLEKPLH